MIFSVVSLFAAISANLFPAGDFENGDNGGWHFKTPLWRVENGIGYAKSRGIVLDVGEGGKKIDWPWTDGIKVEPGCSYKISMRVKDGGFKIRGGMLYVGVGWYTADNRKIGKTFANRVADNDLDQDGWFRFEANSGPLPADVDRFSFFVWTPDSVTGQIYFDDFAVVATMTGPGVRAVHTSAYRDLGTHGPLGLRAEYFANPVKIPPKTLRGHFEVATPSGIRKIEAQLEDGIAAATVEVDQLSMGTHPIAFVLSRTGGRVIGRGKVAFTRVSNMPKRKVWIDRHQRAIVDGKPFFPLGMYFTGVKEYLLDYYAKGPFNCLMPYNWPTRKQLDWCLERNLRVIYPMENAYPGRKPVAHSKKMGNDYVKEMFEKVKDHPAILAWYICDELPSSMDWALRERHQLLKRLDPDHPTWCVIYEPENYRPFLGGYDIAGVDPYPIGNHGDAKATSISIASSWTLEAKNAMFGFRPIWNVPQAFNWAWYRKAEYGKNGVDMPTEEELRSMTWQSIAAGANGIVYYSFFNIYDGEKEPLRSQIFNYVCKVAQEVRDREQILLSPLPPPEIVRLPKGVVARSWKTRDGDIYLLACNTLRKAVKGMVSVTGCKDHALDLAAIDVYFGKLVAEGAK